MNLLMQLKLILRTWMKNRFFITSAFLSLVVGFTCCNLLVAFVINEFKISKGGPDKDLVFVLKTENPMTLETTKEQTSFILPKVPPMLQERYHEVESFCRMQSAYDLTVEKEEFSTKDALLLNCDASIHDFVEIPTLFGNLKKTLSTPGQVAITTSFAQKVFGKINVIGSSFYTSENGDKVIQEVSCIVDDSYASSFLTFDILSPLDEENYFGGVAFLKLYNANDQEVLFSKIEKDLELFPKFSDKCHYYLESFSDFYFDKTTQTHWDYLLKRDRMFLYIGIVSALVILLVACFNFINLFAVRLLRSNESNAIQKIMGAGKIELKIQLLMETFLIIAMGFACSVVLVFICMPSFNTLFGAHLTLSFLTNKFVLLSFLVLIGFMTIVPVLFLGYRLDSPLGQVGNNSQTETKRNYSNVMVCLQFGFSIILIIVATLYKSQLQFIAQTADIDPNIIEVDCSGISPSDFVHLKDQIEQVSMVESYTESILPFLNPPIALGDDNISRVEFAMGKDFMEVHNIHLLKGRGFSEISNTNEKAVLVNETYYNLYNKETQIGEMFEIGGVKKRLLGVVEDFHILPFTAKVQPAEISIFQIKENDPFFSAVLQIKTVDGMQDNAIQAIRSLWNDNFEEREFYYTNLADNFQLQHKEYIRLSKMVRFFTIISFLLTALGLFGIARFSVERRTKEIGVRKVNGASVGEILQLLGKDFITLIVVAFCIASPIAYFLSKTWLEKFAYRTNISSSIFVLAGVCALLIALLTVIWQTYSAARKNPVESLKYE